MKRTQGQSVIEVIVAVSIFAIVAGSSVIAILGSLSSIRLAEEESQAAFIASEGLEATKSIRNQAWANLINGTYGLSLGSIWTFSGASDIDPSGKFTRTVDIASVTRDGNGTIVTSGGTVDTETKKITSTVSWNFTPTRQNSVIMTMYLTNWQLGKSSSVTPQFCSTFCVSLGYTNGICRSGTSQCITNGETPEHAGNHLCTAPGGTCCCQL